MKKLVPFFIAFFFSFSVFAQGVILQDHHLSFSQSPISRSEAVYLIMTARYTEFPAVTGDVFPDVSKKLYHAKYLSFAKEKGVISGFGDKDFRPHAVVTRAAFIKILSETFDLEKALPHTFTDISSDHWVSPYLGITEKYNVFPGLHTTFLPNEYVSQEDVLFALFQLQKQNIVFENILMEVPVKIEEKQTEEKPVSKISTKKSGDPFHVVKTGGSRSHSGGGGSVAEKPVEPIKEPLEPIEGEEESQMNVYTPRVFSVDRFVYQLQDTSYDQLKNISYDVAVIDWQDSDLDNREISELQAQGKIMISYLSIGEAEEYRSYWKEDWNNNPPAFLEEENPDWPGNYKVRYWDEDWKQEVFAMIDEVQLRGYDGIYLDIVDGYYYFEQKGRVEAKQEMIDFVKEIAAYGRKTDSDFIVIPQNAIELVEDSAYLAIIDGIGKESTWFIDDEKTSQETRDWELPFLRKAQEAGKKVFSIDYPTHTHLQCEFYWNAKAENFIPLVGNRDLDRLFFIDCTPRTQDDLNAIRDIINAIPEKTIETLPAEKPADCPLDAEWYDCEGYDAEGYNREGYNKSGYGRDGYDENGYNIFGYGEAGYDDEGYGEDGYSEGGYDRDGCYRNGECGAFDS